MLKPLVRVWTLTMKEIVEVIRQPFLVLALVLGPFLILFIFAVGHRAQQPPLTAILVIPSNVPDLSRDPNFWRGRFGASVTITTVTEDEAAARQAVDQRNVDLALVVPADTTQILQSGKQATIRVLTNSIDPVSQAYIGFVSYILSSELNKQVITEAAAQAQGDISRSRPLLADLQTQLGALQGVPSPQLQRMRTDLDQLNQTAGQLQSLAPGLVAAPFTSQVETVSRIIPTYVDFYSPGVLALLLQHMAITFTALALVRERLLGMVELYTVAPTSTTSVLLGKYASYGVISIVVGGALTFLITRLLGVPILGSVGMYWLTLALLIFASLGIGLTISLLSPSQENAVQLTMLFLLASVFFSGFFLSLDTLQIPALIISYILPVTYANIALQDLMLRGQLGSYGALIDLAIIGVIFVVLSSLLMIREFRRT